MAKKGELTPKQELFIREYLIDKNATQAAIRAWYSEKTAYSIWEENLRKPEIKAKINELLAIVTDKLDITIEYIAQGLKELYEVSKEQIDKDWIKHIKDPQSALSALEKLGKRKKMFTDKLEHSGEIKAWVVILPPLDDL